MMQAASVFRVPQEFDDFLFASIDEEGNNGTSLTVLSALTQLDFDPWQVAAELARLSGDTATRRLSSLLASLPNRRPSAPRDVARIATRLVALLPRRSAVKIPPRALFAGFGTSTNFSIRNRPILFTIFVALLLSLAWITGR
jgi:hypothetical protein